MNAAPGRRYLLPLALGLALGWATAARADGKDDIGYRRLAAELGAALPDGSAVAVIHTEARVFVDHDGDPATPDVAAWLPDPADPELAGKHFTDRSGATAGAHSGHATDVARRFYGRASAIAPGIDRIELWLADHWLDSGFLRPGPGPPAVAAGRVANHSWVGTTGSAALDSELLRRLDWQAERDQTIHCAGLTNGGANRPLLASAFHVLTVGRSDGGHGSGGSVALDADYTAGRTRPDLVVPQGSTSAATPVVCAAATLLVQAGHEHPGWSTDPVATHTTTRAGDIVYNAERLATVRAALQAGADRVVPANGDGSALLDYRRDPARRAANGLDSHFGAGQLDIANSWHILAAGEQNSAEDLPDGTIGWQGFDFDPHFGGAAGSNRRARYYFRTGPEPRSLYASLVWPLHIDGGTPAAFDGRATLYDLDLRLFDVTGGGETLVAEQASHGDNSEHLWVALQPQRSYRLQVDAGGALFDGAYALAWRMPRDADHDGLDDGRDNCAQRANPPQRDSDGDGYGNRCDADLDQSGAVGFADLALLRVRWAGADPDADLDGDGVVGAGDLDLLRQDFLRPPGPGAVP